MDGGDYHEESVECQRCGSLWLDMVILGTTMAFHRRNIFRKAGVSRQQDLVAVIFRGSALTAGLGHS